MSILESITIANLKRLSHSDLNNLCSEIREYLIDVVSKNGGHLASNLGIVELTLALHRVFDCPSDKIIWDVGHQCYVHKIITGRKDAFLNLRQENGLSGFPKKSESDCDCFETGHSSTAISAAVGFARARTLSSASNKVIAVVGDASITGGMSFEALNDAGGLNSSLIVVLNDNEMSISENVGALAAHLNKVRSGKRYNLTKDYFLKKLEHSPGVTNFLRNIKRRIKYFFCRLLYLRNWGSNTMGRLTDTI